MSHYIHDGKVKALEIIANTARELLLDELMAAGSGHTAGPMGMADIFTAMYFHVLNHDPKNPSMPERDWLFLSNGHITPIRYVSMAQAGYFPVEELKTLRKFGTRLQGHPEREKLPGVESTSGPLGSGLSQAAGVAYAHRMDGKKNRIYCIMSDGEHDSGNIWEAVLFAGKYKLSNLVGIIDRNNIQIDGMTEDIMPLESLRAKYEAFNWHVLEVDGHNIRQFVDATEEAHTVFEKPTVIIAHTIPGKGIPEIEFDYRWHGIPPGSGPTDVFKDKATQGKEMLAKLRTLEGKIKSEHE
jgi:transketolase